MPFINILLLNQHAVGRALPAGVNEYSTGVTVRRTDRLNSYKKTHLISVADLPPTFRRYFLTSSLSAASSGVLSPLESDDFAFTSAPFLTRYLTTSK
jgi:hypothetical protein